MNSHHIPLTCHSWAKTTNVYLNILAGMDVSASQNVLKHPCYLLLRPYSNTYIWKKSFHFYEHFKITKISHTRKLSWCGLQDADDFYPPPPFPLQRSWKGGILVSPCPSVRLSVCLWTESGPLCIFNNTHQIHFILAHLINQNLQQYSSDPFHTSTSYQPESCPLCIFNNTLQIYPFHICTSYQPTSENVLRVMFVSKF